VGGTYEETSRLCISGVHFCYRVSNSAAAALPKWHRLIVRLRLKVYGIAIAVCPSRKIPKRGEKVMQMERATKLLKRVWKAVALAELVVAVGALLFIFSHYFSYSVFVSNLHRKATAATSTQPR
jgi:hypothetical protein